VVCSEDSKLVERALRNTALRSRVSQNLPGDWWVITISVYGDTPTRYIHSKRYSERAGIVNGP
jgi:hypothetical protein